MVEYNTNQSAIQGMSRKSYQTQKWSGCRRQPLHFCVLLTMHVEDPTRNPVVYFGLAISKIFPIIPAEPSALTASVGIKIVVALPSAI